MLLAEAATYSEQLEKHRQAEAAVRMQLAAESQTKAAVQARLQETEAKHREMEQNFQNELASAVAQSTPASASVRA